MGVKLLVWWSAGTAIEEVVDKGSFAVSLVVLMLLLISFWITSVPGNGTDLVGGGGGISLGGEWIIAEVTRIGFWGLGLNSGVSTSIGGVGCVIIMGISLPTEEGLILICSVTCGVCVCLVVVCAAWVLRFAVKIYKKRTEKTNKVDFIIRKMCSKQISRRVPIWRTVLK